MKKGLTILALALLLIGSAGAAFDPYRTFIGQDLAPTYTYSSVVHGAPRYADNAYIGLGTGSGSSWSAVPDVKLYWDSSDSRFEITSTDAYFDLTNVTWYTSDAVHESMSSNYPTTFTAAVTASGGVTGDITGDVTGNLTGDVTGDVTGDLTGDVTGDVTGNLTGDVTGDVTGNLTGDVTGDVTGNLTGDVTGNLTGNVTQRVLTVNGVVVPLVHVITVPINAASVDQQVFISDGDWTVNSIKESHTVAGNDASPVNVTVMVCDDGEAPNAGLPAHDTVIDLKGTINTVQDPAISSTAANYTLADNDTLALDFSGNLTTLAGGTITVELHGA